MSRFNNKNKAAKKQVTNFAGGKAYAQNPEMELVSILLTSFMQDQFYRKAEDTGAELTALLRHVNPEFAAKAAVYARQEFGMRSVTHVLAGAISKSASGNEWAKSFYDRIVKRPDDMLEIAAICMGKGEKTLPNAMKKGFASAIGRFDGYQLAKYRGEGKEVKMVDIVNLVHPKANSRNEEALRQLMAGSLKNTATWEAQLSKAGQIAENEAEKSLMTAEIWADMLEKGCLGYLAMLRNINNILEQAPDKVPLLAARLLDREHLKKAYTMPFQIMVAKDAVQNSTNSKGKKYILPVLDRVLEFSLDNVPRFDGKTLVVVDDSGSMSAKANAKGIGSRSCLEVGAVFAAALAKSNDADLLTFSDQAKYCKTENTMMSTANAIIKGAAAGGTDFHSIFKTANRHYDRIIILSDMQGWIGHDTPNAAFTAYKKKFGANPFVYSFDLAGYGTAQFPGDKIFALAGFSDKVFDIMNMLETDRMALVNTIHAITWN